jgi:hypothetical protein
MTEEQYRELEHFKISGLFIIAIFFLFVLTIQFVVVKPLFDYLIRKEKMTNTNLVLVAFILVVANGLILGLKFGSIEIGYMDVIENIGLWLFIFSLFYITDFLTFKKLTALKG